LVHGGYLTHFEHRNIIKYCKRPFDSIELHDETIIDNINQKVGLNDELYIVGDFAFCGPPADHYRRMINCKNVHLVLGNSNFCCWFPGFQEPLPQGDGNSCLT